MSLTKENIEVDELNNNIDYKKSFTPNRNCFHCGNENGSQNIILGDKYFCCQGCKTVYEILSQNDLCQYYDIENHPGLSVKEVNQPIFDFLDDEEVQNQIIHFQDEQITKVSFYIPSIHCSSCIWVLENFYKIDAATLESRVDFLKKSFFITFKTRQTSLRKIVELLTKIGYEPLISLQDQKSNNENTIKNRNLVTKIAVAGFCTGNIMMFSFPEYFGLDSFSQTFGYVFKYLNLGFSLPVLFYSGSVYFESVFQSLRKGLLNIDAPILLGILATFVRSLTELVFQNGAGYFDSMSGLIFLLLIGKWFTTKTFNFLSFERDYKSYFPLSVYKLENDVEKAISVNALKKGDKIRIKNNQIIPADSILYRGKAHIDFSFVTGESALITKKEGDLIYAGGRQKGMAIDLEIVREVSQSYLTQLWNNEIFNKTQRVNHNYQGFSDAVAKYFTISILFIAIATAIYWSFIDNLKSWNSFTAILIIACPCTLALSYPMALGNTLRKFGKGKFFLKNSNTIEILAKTNALVLDKTGTITENESFSIHWSGEPLSQFEKNAVVALCSNSTHPLSQIIAQNLAANKILKVNHFKEISGKGLIGEVSDLKIKIGKLDFVSLANSLTNAQTSVHVSIDEVYKGYFVFANKYKTFVSEMVHKMAKTHKLYVLSGDSDAERENLNHLFNKKAELYFNQSPQQKLDFIKRLQDQHQKVIVCGDGLNDAGALKQANVGIAITQDATYFTPASDAILEGNALEDLPKFIDQAKQSMKAVKISFLVSLVYNAIGLSFAIRGDLQPVIAAILMPLSSISVVLTAILWSGNYKNRL
jgi:P-type Cu+ transporter